MSDVRVIVHRSMLVWMMVALAMAAGMVGFVAGLALGLSAR